jgi:hypothetical protein
MTAEQVRQARDLLTRPGNTVSCKARLLGASRAAIYRHVPGLPVRTRPAAALPRGQNNAGQRPCRPEGPAGGSRSCIRCSIAVRLRRGLMAVIQRQAGRPR